MTFRTSFTCACSSAPERREQDVADRPLLAAAVGRSHAAGDRAGEGDVVAVAQRGRHAGGGVGRIASSALLRYARASRFAATVESARSTTT